MKLFKPSVLVFTGVSRSLVCEIERNVFFDPASVRYFYFVRSPKGIIGGGNNVDLYAVFDDIAKGWPEERFVFTYYKPIKSMEKEKTFVRVKIEFHDVEGGFESGRIKAGSEYDFYRDSTGANLPKVIRMVSEIKRALSEGVEFAPDEFPDILKP